MAGLQRSAISFRRQGSSGLVWEDKFLNELTQMANQKEETENKAQQEHQEDKVEPAPATPKNSSRTAGLTIERSRSNGGGRGFRTGRVSPAIEPPSPKVSACGFCSAFAKNDKDRRRPPKSGKRKM
ncbi:uncharacterized protein At1g15400-like [Olea europaea var. sylvestris]|uniref:MAPK kinase substrate protein n=1 Tax=Olea europaea subsp. europaea TaxID=158383 RepID=A0A8S0R4E1_OLEEU|nr:uncharacterized protein At1g15400-like [Olea europaea var. sylvestris]CAA2973310.1 Hypothetical predicted protein [Olea europaea subsp. europaea]